MLPSSPDREIVEHPLRENEWYSLRRVARDESDNEIVVVLRPDINAWIVETLGPVSYVGRGGGVAMRCSAGDWMAFSCAGGDPVGLQKS